ncbi:Virginiamycin B lyase [Candidatus Entotheonellaceae bacterium PAL068K]
MPRAHALLRAGFPYVKTLGMRRITSNPVDLAVGNEGRLYVLSRSELATEIRRLTWDDEDRGVIGGPGRADGRFVWPVNLILDADENLFVSDEACQRISIFTRAGEFLHKWGEAGEADGQLNRPAGMAFDPDGHLYVVDSLNHRIQKFTRDGRFLAKWGRCGSGDAAFNLPWGIAVDDTGDVYVADWGNDRIQKFSADGQFILAFGTSGAGRGQLKRPSGVAVDLHGDIYVADWGNNRVQLFNPDGRYIEQFIGDATLSKMARRYVRSNPKPLRLREMAWLEPQKRFHGPVSVRVDDQFRLYVADCGPHRIQVYQKDADVLLPDEVAPELSAPTLSTV